MFSMAERANWLSRASRKELLLWTVGPWVAVFLVGHIMLTNAVPTLEGLAIHGFCTNIGAGAMLRAAFALPEAVSILIPWVAILGSAFLMLRTRRLLYLVLLEVLCGLQFGFGIVLMIGIASV